MMQEQSSKISGQLEFPYTLLRKNVKNINLRVRADGTVTISAGHHVPLDHFHKFLLDKEYYIQKSLSEFKLLEKKKQKKKTMIVEKM